MERILEADGARRVGELGIGTNPHVQTMTGDLLIDVPNVGHRSAFIGAVLRTLPGAEASTGPRRIRLVPLEDRPVDEVYGSMKMDEPVDEYIERTRGR